MKRYQISDEILKGFIESLNSDRVSRITVSNYKSDIHIFFVWLQHRVRLSGVFSETFSDILPFFKKEVGKQYKDYLAQMKLPASSVNRSLSSLRRLSRFLLERGFLSFDFMEETSNLSKDLKQSGKSEPLLKDFERFLSLESPSKNTVKNYVSDVRQFLNWLEGKNLNG